MTYHNSKHETCIVMDGTCMYNCPTFFLFWKCLADMSYWTNLYLTVADNELPFFHNFKLESYSFCEPCPYSSRPILIEGGLKTTKRACIRLFSVHLQRCWRDHGRHDGRCCVHSLPVVPQLRMRTRLVRNRNDDCSPGGDVYSNCSCRLSARSSAWLS